MNIKNLSQYFCAKNGHPERERETMLHRSTKKNTRLVSTSQTVYRRECTEKYRILNAHTDETCFACGLSDSVSYTVAATVSG